MSGHSQDELDQSILFNYHICLADSSDSGKMSPVMNNTEDQAVTDSLAN